MQSHSFQRLRSLAALTIMGSLVSAAPSMAARFTAAEIGYDNALLSSFNLVTLGSYTNTSGVTTTVGGRSIVEGNVTNGANSGTEFCSTCSGNATSAVDSTGKLYGALTVFGNLASGSNGGFSVGYNPSNGVTTAGTTYIGGTASGYFYAGNKQNLNVVGSASGLAVDYANNIATSQSSFAGTRTNTATGTITTSANGNTAASVFPFTSSALTSQVTRLSSGIAALPGSPGVTAQSLPSASSGSGLFTANADWTSNGKTYGVVTTTIANLVAQTATSFTGINNGSNAATFVIVTGAAANTTYTLPNLNSYADAGKVIYEFVDATSLKFAGAWNGSILAPLASISQAASCSYASCSINGTVIVNAIAQSQAITSTFLFAGDLSGLIPEPASMALFGLGAAAAAIVRRRRRAVDQS